MPFAPAVALESRAAVLDGLERADTIASRIWVTQADRLADLIALTPASLHKGLPAEVGAHLTVPEGTARALLDTAWELRARPRVREAVLTGRLNPRQADVVLDELACVDPAAVEVILTELLAGGGRVVLRPGQLRRWVHRRAVAADPDGAKKRRVLAEREETGVRYRSLPNGLAQKITTGPAVEIQKAMRQLDALTPPRDSDDPDDDRTRGQLLFATETGAIALAAAAHGVGPVPVELELELPSAAESYALTPVTRLPEPVVIRTDLAGLAAAVAGTALAGILGCQHQHAGHQHAGHQHAGHEQAEHGESRASDAGSSVALHDEVAALVPAGRLPRRAPFTSTAGLRSTDWIDLLASGAPTETWEDRFTAIVARYDQPHTIEIDTHHDDEGGSGGGAGGGGGDGDDGGGPTGGPEDGPGSNPGGDPDSKASSNRQWTPPRLSPPTPDALGARSIPTLAGHGPIDPALLGRHLHELTVRRLMLDPHLGVCAADAKTVDLGDLAELLNRPAPPPPPPTKAYAPTDNLRRVVIARYQRCAFPGCSGRARTADLDHARPFDQGGETTLANLHPLCRFHHQVKQRGWTVTRAPDGSSTWTSPTGRQLRSTPGEQ